MKELSASTQVIDQLVQENYELKRKLQELVAQKENVGRNSITADQS
jgi:hypothetical protein